MKFFFKAKNELGEIKEGVVDAANRELALELIQKNKLFIIELDDKKKDFVFSDALNKYLNRVSVKELVIFYRQLAILIKAGVPINYALTAIKDQSKNPFFKIILEEVINDIRDGLSFSEALKKKPEVFSRFSINIIKSGESSGNIRQSVEYVADNIEKNYNLSQKVISAFIYPAVVMLVFSAVAFIFTAFILPKMTVIIKDLGGDLPWYTKTIVFFSDFMAVYWWVVLLGIISFILGIIFFLKTRKGKILMDNLKIKTPVFGTIFQNICITRFTENLAILLKGGIPIIRAVILSSSVVNNSIYEKLFLQVADKLSKGGSIHKVFQNSELIPPIVFQMIRVGEETGQLDLVLNHISNFYKQEVETSTKNLSTLLEPIIMVVIGIAVGVLVFTVMMPIYNLASQIK